MSQSCARNCRSALQVTLAGLCAVLLAACASTPVLPLDPHPSAGEEAKTLRFQSMIDVVDLGAQDIFKRILFGRDRYDIKQPTAIDVRDDWMYIADAGEGMLFKYNLSNRRIEPILWAGDEVAGEVSDIYIARDYSFYVTDVSGKRVLHFSPAGRLLRVFQDAPNISRPIAIHVDEDRRLLYVADEVYSKVVVFGFDGVPIRGFGARGQGPGHFRIVTDMVRARQGGFYISDRIELPVQLFDAQGRYIEHFGEQELMFPTALAEDRFGRVFVSDKSDSLIKVFRQGELIDAVGRNGYGPGEFRYIGDMKIKGNTLYVADTLNGRIQVFDILADDPLIALE